MVDLLAGEFLRARSRRMPVVLVCLAAAVLVLIGVVVIVRGGEPVDFTERWVDLFAFGSLYAAWISALLGASLVGVEFRGGGMTQIVSWEPRRGRVVLAKLLVAAAVGLVCTALVLVLTALLILVLYAAGMVVGIDSLGAVEVRSALAFLAVGALAPVVGGSFAFLLRSSVGGVVVVSAMVMIIEPVVGFIVKPFSRRGPLHGLTSLTGHPDSRLIPDGGNVAAVATALFWVVVMGALAYQAFVARDLTDSD